MYLRDVVLHIFSQELNLVLLLLLLLLLALLLLLPLPFRRRCPVTARHMAMYAMWCCSSKVSSWT